MYNYTNKLLYSSKSRNKRKDGKLRYYICREFDGENLFVEKIKSPPADMAFSNSGSERFQWYIHNLDILAEKYKIIMVKNEPDSKDNGNGNWARIL